MHRVSRVIVVSFITLATSTVALAQTATPNPEMKKWEPLIGKWVNQEERRATPDGPWEKVSSEWEIRWMPGGFFVETPGNVTSSDGRVVSWVQVHGYDASQETLFSRSFTSDGTMGSMVQEWAETTLKVQITEVTADGTKGTARCTWVHAGDFRSSEGTCERLTDGKWWVFRKVKGKKQ